MQKNSCQSKLMPNHLYSLQDKHAKICKKISPPPPKKKKKVIWKREGGRLVQKCTEATTSTSGTSTPEL